VQYSSSHLSIAAGSLASLVNPYGANTVTLGCVTPAPDGMLHADPVVPVGTACVVLQLFEDEAITSGPAYRILLDAGSGPQAFWVYADELQEVSLVNEKVLVLL